MAARAAVALLMLVQFRAPGNRPDFSDFKVYWLAGAKTIAHQTVYDVEGHYQYKYSPFVALFWGLPHVLGGSRYFWALAHYAACALGFLVLWYVCARLLDRERSLWLWLIALITFSIGLRDELKLGQANLWPLLLVLPAWVSGARPRDARGFDARGFAIGAAWAFAVQWKLYALVLGPLWLLRRRWAVFAGAITFTVLSLGAALAAVHGGDFALQENISWLRSLTASSEELLISQYNVSALGIFGKWGLSAGLGFGAWAYVLWLMLAAAWGLILLWSERDAAMRGKSYLVFWSTSWAWAGIVLLNPLVWPYWLMFCLPLFLAYVHEQTLTRGLQLDAAFIIVVSVFLLANWLQNTELVHAGLSFVAVCGLMFDAQRRARRRDGRQLPPFLTLSRSAVPSTGAGAESP
ncbi:MAG TPA: glycosyltransferase family 87 protein [Polyangiales bacterium]|nr:glycosyltransferase family 87 protein [Polyangiales bacterium]